MNFMDQKIVIGGKTYLNSSALNQKVCGTAFTPMEFDPQLKIPKLVSSPSTK